MMQLFVDCTVFTYPKDDDDALFCPLFDCKTLLGLFCLVVRFPNAYRLPAIPTANSRFGQPVSQR